MMALAASGAGLWIAEEQDRGWILLFKMWNLYHAPHGALPSNLGPGG